MSDTRIKASGNADRILFDYADDVKRFHEEMSKEVENAYSVLDDLMDAWTGEIAGDFCKTMEDDLADLDTCLERAKKLYEQLDKRGEEISASLADFRRGAEGRK